MLKKVGKKYKEVSKLVEQTKKYSLEEGVDLLKKVSYTKFVSSVEVHIKTYADPKYNDQMLRGTVILPHGIGKTVKIGAFVSDDKIEEVKSYGVEIVGNTELIKKIEEGEIKFDVLITTQDMMRDLSKVAKLLGPKGLMPSPKTGTVSNNLKEIIDEIKKGRVEYKIDKTGNIHVAVGKLDFDNNKIIDNINSLIKSLEDNKPTGIKGKLIKKVVIAPTMGPGINLDI